jgi:hypothetical protein
MPITHYNGGIVLGCCCGGTTAGCGVCTDVVNQIKVTLPFNADTGACGTAWNSTAWNLSQMNATQIAYYTATYPLAFPTLTSSSLALGCSYFVTAGLPTSALVLTATIFSNGGYASIRFQWVWSNTSVTIININSGVAVPVACKTVLSATWVTGIQISYGGGGSCPLLGIFTNGNFTTLLT